MKRVLALLIATSLVAGCAQVQEFKSAVTAATASIQNPVTKKMLAQIEVAASVAVAGLVQYRRACLRGDLAENCRENIRKMQVYTRQIPPVLKNLRAFVKNNDQVNAIVAYNTVKQLLADFKTVALASGVGS